jgi:hypothetical protein
LPLIILNQAIPMIASVVFENEPCLWVIQVGSSGAIEQFRLNLRQRQACLDQ